MQILKHLVLTLPLQSGTKGWSWLAVIPFRGYGIAENRKDLPLGTMFDCIFKPERGGLLRGTELGDSLDAVLGRENDGVSINDSPDRRTLTVSGKVDPSYELHYNVYYIYDADRNVRSLSISVQYNQYIDSLPPFADFSALLKDVSALLKQRYGKPDSVEDKVKASGKDKFEKWLPKDGAVKKALLVTYAEPKNKIKKAFRLDMSSSA